MRRAPHLFGARALPVLRRFARAQEGVTIIEFALILPGFLIMLLGALDVGHTLYMQSVVQGAVQKAARDGTLETSAGTNATSRDAIDAVVESQIKQLHNDAEVSVQRRFYRSFSQAAAAQAEPFTDSASGPNKNGVCDGGEPFVDNNNNGVWDADGGNAINAAGARDNVVFTVTVSYPRLFPIDRLIGGHGTTHVVARTVLSNQPYGDQGTDGTPTVRYCS
ncbi:Flp pilus assembly protein TadG [Sphingobium sp. B2D3A]|uniref:TadE/TadG family type IV pilus assembly protein n=1 Tax=unclassified Sphingobium TaxID=2611147 RepID=UPI0022240BA0|nr:MULTISPECIES: TadE/TadG family type IV pilus assembly protein [unclassified Sphingobium]MCW2337863.1 Flp pilus assembly protein TadG [Sphingobium sp. B2D3A]MCW2384321.1 Flp pilus assembly protein TadG [Sphingobium sp. B2D3D]